MSIKKIRYILKKDKIDEIITNFSVYKIHQETGISRQTIYNILDGQKTKRITANLLVKNLNINAKVEDYFDKIEG